MLPPRRSGLVILFLIIAQVSALVISAIGLPPDSLEKRQSQGGPGQVVTRCTVPGTVALTFDDGPFIYLNQIVDTLTRAGANGTFFFNGNNWGCIYDQANVDRVRYAYDNGHQIASHTWSHAHLNTLSLVQLHWELGAVEEAILRITGAFPAFTRPPFGEFNANVLAVARLHGQTIANWDFDSRDTGGASGPDSVNGYNRLIASHPTNILTLNHEIRESTATVVIPQIVRSLQGAGYRLVTVAECLGREPYLWVEEPQERNADWTCPRRR